MPLHFPPLRGLLLFLLFFGLTLLTPFAADKKRKAVQAEAKSKTKVRTTQKADLKQQAKAIRDSPLAPKKNKQEDERKGKKRDEVTNKLAAKQREEKTNNKSHGKEKSAQREAEKKNDKTTDRLAKREAEKKNDKSKDKLANREAAKKSGKQKIAAKKSQPEKDTKRANPSQDTKIAEAKAKVNTKANKQDPQAKPEEKSKELAKHEKASSNPKQLAKADRGQETKAEDKIKNLPPGNFTLRPITKAVPKVELKFSLARATAVTTFDAPPPRDNGPDVIDVIEYDSPETKRLDEVLRSEMKVVRFSSVPSVSHKKLDVGKMDTERIKQIQESLAKKGYYLGEISGQYSEATIEAMRKFQEVHRVDVTGYATAQSLKLLGLTDW